MEERICILNTKHECSLRTFPTNAHGCDLDHMNTKYKKQRKCQFLVQTIDIVDFNQVIDGPKECGE